ncbi:MAG: hypothetical protein MJE68_04940 [Proteobacteria bacterium]|nr:hypothetical protein [Pseudomonadota bacterium]
MALLVIIHCIAIFKESESYDAMKVCLSDIVKDVKELETIQVLDHSFSLTGPEKLILFEKLNIVLTFLEIPNSEEVQTLWRSF